MTRSSSDTLSLTLPCRSLSRTRWRRPRRPTLQELWFLAWTAFSVVLAVLDLLRGDPITGCWQAGNAGLWWRAYQRARRGHPRALSLFGTGWICGGGLLLIILGVPG